MFQLSQELKRLQRRKTMMSGEGPLSQSISGSGCGPGSPGNGKEQPLFTLKQVGSPHGCRGSWFKVHAYIGWLTLCTCVDIFPACLHQGVK